MEEMKLDDEQKEMIEKAASAFDELFKRTDMPEAIFALKQAIVKKWGETSDQLKSAASETEEKLKSLNNDITALSQDIDNLLK